MDRVSGRTEEFAAGLGVQQDVLRTTVRYVAKLVGLRLVHECNLVLPRPELPYSSSAPSATILFNGPCLTINDITSNRISAAAIVVCSAFVSYAGATSTISAAMKLMPSSPRMMVRSSRVDQPPVSGVPVAGATDAWLDHDSNAMWRAEDVLTSRIQGIDIDAQVDRFGHANSIPDLLDDTSHTDRVDFSCFYNLEAAIPVDIIV